MISQHGIVHTLATVLLFLSAVLWVSLGLRAALGALRLPWLKDASPATDEDCPRISILFTARDEEEKMPQALATLVALDYPDFEIIAVDDRSQDSTGRILDDFTREHPLLRVVCVRELPPGWLGKTHGLQKAYEQSTGEWLLFTDADVQFSPDVLRRAITLARQNSLDHLTLLAQVEMIGFLEKMIITFAAVGFDLYVDPARVSDPRSRNYIGVGAFQLVRRAAYEASGTHRRLAMEVVDDMKLGKILKLAGFRSCAAIASRAVTVRWHEGLSGVIGGVTKNFFAAAGFSVVFTASQILALLLVDVLPFLALPLVHSWARVFAGVTVGFAICFHAGVAFGLHASPLYAFTHPLGALVFSYMLLRSAVVTLWRGGVVWRDTFYPLEELRRGQV